MKTKICSYCNIEKAFYEFYNRKDIKCGKNPMCKICMNNYNYAYRIKPEKKQGINRSSRKRNLKKFNLTIEQYEKICNNQNGLCAICNKEETIIVKRTNKIRGLAIDHDHKTGKVRGLLCFKHNRMIGLAKDDIQILQNAIEYLKRNE